MILTPEQLRRRKGPGAWCERFASLSCVPDGSCVPHVGAPSHPDDSARQLAGARALLVYSSAPRHVNHGSSCYRLLRQGCPSALREILHVTLFPLSRYDQLHPLSPLLQNRSNISRHHSCHRRQLGVGHHVRRRGSERTRDRHLLPSVYSLLFRLLLPHSWTRALQRGGRCAAR